MKPWAWRGGTRLWFAGLATAAGALAVKILRQPRTLMDGIGRLGEIASMAFSVWRLLRRKGGNYNSESVSIRVHLELRTVYAACFWIKYSLNFS